jgi:hypothetical protein
MLTLRARSARLFVAVAGIVSFAASYAPSAVAQTTVPSKLSDSAFWKLVTDVSEPGGYFRSDNFVSNETTYQWVIPELLRTTKPGGVYLGVGPDQNFTYVVALKPRITFIFDIRRQNMLTHLMYKALIEASSDRADFISRLFSRPRPAGLDSNSSAETIFSAFAPVAPDSAKLRKNALSIRDALTKTHGFKLSDDDLAGIAYVYQAFVEAGPEITYNFNQGRNAFGRGMMPSYAALQIETDSAGVRRSYMANEANFRTLKEAEVNNLLVPVVGDFAGTKAIKTVGEYLKQNRLTVTAFYLSNVEQYLFQQGDDWRRFYTNIGTLPLDSSSTFIRSVFNGMGYSRGPAYSPYMRNQQLLASMLDQFKAFSAGHLTQYYDVINTSR